MASVTLRDLYAAELHDLMNAEKQLLAELPVMAARATSARLQHALDEHHAETKVHIERVRLLIEQLNEPARATSSGAMAALIEDARIRLRETERGDILDAALIAAAQRIEHYEMASYGTVRSYAESLGDYAAVLILQQTLDEEGHTDHTLTRLAERGINQAASEDLVSPPWLKTGVWMSEARGFAVTSPHADSDVIAPRPVPPPTRATGVYDRTTVPSELVMAHDEPEGRGPSTSLGAGEGEEADRHVPDSGDINPRATEQPKTTDPRIERYRDR